MVTNRVADVGKGQMTQGLEGRGEDQSWKNPNLQSACAHSVCLDENYHEYPCVAFKEMVMLEVADEFR